ncbi:MAG: hypothetical protein RMJ84_00065 [Sandaracinaceae bacterium]|nr:hypothetical protein [Sandaracinaceae bacterium]
METLALPLEEEALPQEIRRFASPKAPERARLAAARGLVPLKGPELVSVLLQLAHDPVEAVAQAARQSLDGLPPNIIDLACESALHPAFLHALAMRFRGDEKRLERLVANRATSNQTVAMLAQDASEALAERIALDETRMLQAPEIIAALYRNPKTRMSTVDRLIDLAARNGVRVEGIPTFDAHVQAIQGQPIIEASEEPAPGDLLFSEALREDGEESAIESESEEGQDPSTEEEGGSERVRSRFQPLAMRIAQMNLAEKLRLALIGNAAARSLLVRDSNKLVALAAVASPQTTEAEAASYAQSRYVSEDVLRYIANRREWMSNYEIKRNLLFNPKTPVGISIRYVSHLYDADLRALSKSKGIPSALKTAALQRLAKKVG